MKTETQGLLLGFVGVFIFGLTLPAARYAIPYLDPVFIGLGRACVAALVAMVILFIYKAPIPNASEFKQLVIVALGVVFGFPLLTAWAMQTVPASHGGVVIGVLPLATAFVGVFISHERPSLGFWITGIIGGALVVTFSLWNGFAHFSLGDLALLGSVICAAIGYGFGARLVGIFQGWQVICWTLVISLPFAIIPTVITAPSNFSSIPTSVWLAFAYMALMSQLFGFFFWYKGLSMGGIARVSQTQLIQPFITIFAAAILLGESLNFIAIGFAIAVVASVAISRKMPIHSNNSLRHSS